jgi:hypothetical protein
MKGHFAARRSTSEIAMFGRLIEAEEGNLDARLARYVLTLGFPESDQERMSDLALLNQQGSLTADEHQELENYVRSGHLLALLHSKARKSLKRRRAS